MHLKISTTMFNIDYIALFNEDCLIEIYDVAPSKKSQSSPNK